MKKNDSLARLLAFTVKLRLIIQLYKDIKLNKIFMIVLPLPVQLNPSPTNPELHSHMKEPLVFLHSPLLLHGELVTHSSMSNKYT